MAVFPQLEVDIMYDRLVSLAAEGKHSGLAKFRILSVDIECNGRKVRVLCSCRCCVGADAVSTSRATSQMRSWTLSSRLLRTFQFTASASQSSRTS